MKRFSLLLLAASSLLAVAANGATRPHYGGTLRIALHHAPQAIDPTAALSPSVSNLFRQVFETLVVLDARGRPQPLLATSWQSEPGNQRWRFLVRSGVSFHDGTPLDAAAVVASLRNNNPSWKILSTGNAVLVQIDSPDPDLPVELALARNAIVRRGGEQPSGTGPFSIDKWDPGKELTLAANDQYWGGRPFLDSVDVTFGEENRDPMIALDLGKADVVEVAPENIQRTRAQGRSVVTSEPDELLALGFTSDPKSDSDARTRAALAASVDTAAINNVVLQGGGEPTAALLPNWLSGYGFLFNPGAGAERPQRTEAYLAPLTLAYDASDDIARVIADRVLLNARDAGITLQLTSAASADMRLVRIPLNSSDSHVALTELARSLQLPVPKFSGNSVADCFAAEKALLQTHRVVPLLHLRSAAALRPNVRNWVMFPDGSWSLSDVWLAPEKP